MRRLKLLFTGLVVAGVMSLVPGSPGVAAASTSHSVYSFELTTPNTAASPNGGKMSAPGDWIEVTGGGTFNPATRTIRARGSFVHHKADGSVHCRGSWKATAFKSFTEFGSNSEGEARGVRADSGSNAEGDVGGMLALTVTHICRTVRMTMTGIPMTVTSTVNAPAGSRYKEGTTVGDFTVSTGGPVVIERDE